MLTEIFKPLPANLDAERALLGAALLDYGAALQVLGLVREDHFPLPEHRVIFRRLLLVSAQGSVPDLPTVTDSLHSGGNLERVGGPAYVSSLIDGVPRMSNIAHYAAIVGERARLRALIHYAEDLQRRAFDADEWNTGQLIEQAVSAVLSIADGDGGLVLARQWKEVAASAVQEVGRSIGQPELAKRIRFGLTDLDDMTGGLRRRELVSIVAPTSNGKTLLAAQCAFQADRDGFKVLFFSAEMPAEQLALREIAYQAGVKFYFVQRPEKLNPDEYQRLVAASQREHSVRIVDRDVTPARVWAMAEAVKRTHGLDLVIVDYDQLVIEAGIKPDSDDANIFRHQRAFVFRAKKLAERLDVCFVLLSQLRKLSPAVLKGARPHLDDIWGDSSIRNTPHLILWVSRDFFTKGMDKKHERAAKMYVLKSRNGRTGVVPLEFDPERVRFLDAPSGEKD